MARTPRPSLEAIQAFAVFADTLNFSEAARKLHISQPALHTKIRRLAQELDVPLYARSGRKLLLTRHGELVARHGRDLQARAGLFINTIRGGTEPERIILAAGEGAFLYLLGPVIQSFTRRLDGKANITLLTLDRASTLEVVLSGRANIGVAPLDTVPDDLAAEPLWTVGQALVLPKGHQLARKRAIRLRDLAGEQLIVPRPGQPHREMLARALQSAQVPWSVAVEAGGWELMIQFVKMGIGLAVVNDYCHIPAPLVAVPIPELPSLKFQVFYLRGAGPQGNARDLVDTLVANCKMRP